VQRAAGMTLGHKGAIVVLARGVCLGPRSVRHSRTREIGDQRAPWEICVRSLTCTGHGPAYRKGLWTSYPQRDAQGPHCEACGSSARDEVLSLGRPQTGPMARSRSSGLGYGINVHMLGLFSTMQVAPQGQTTAPSQYSLGKHFKSFQHETPLDAAGGRHGLSEPTQGTADFPLACCHALAQRGRTEGCRVR